MVKAYNTWIIFFVISSMSSLTSYADQRSPENDTQPQTILVLGDSLSAGYGIQIEQSWVTLLTQHLKLNAVNKQSNYQIHNASISGETTGGGLRSLPRLLEKYQPKIIIIELGANDGLRGFPLKTIEQNLSTLITLAQAKNTKVILTGIHIPPNYGQRYATAFHSLYSTLAKRYKTALIPFLLEGIATRPELMQADRLHPKAEAQETIKSIVWKALKPLLK